VRRGTDPARFIPMDEASDVEGHTGLFPRHTSAFYGGFIGV